MTTSEIDRLSRILTDMRVESASQFARLDERLNAVPDLVIRVTALEKGARFTWHDVFKVTAALAAAVVVLSEIKGWGA